MALINEHYLKLSESCYFTEMWKKVNAYHVSHPNVSVINLGMNDVSLPLAPVVGDAMHKAVDELLSSGSFRGYGPVEGYQFLREAIVRHDYAAHGVRLDVGEIFVNDGGKGDLSNMSDIERWENNVGVPGVCSPVYVDSNVMWGRAGVQAEGLWSGVDYLPCNESTGFVPAVPDHRVDFVYLCQPGNPTGVAFTRARLTEGLKYALKNDTLIFFDCSYEAYINDPDIPHSIYEIRGAKKCCVEFRSYSKTAGFTGVRCGYTVIPKMVTAATMAGERISLHRVWQRRQQTKCHGTSYISQRGAEATYTAEGKRQVREGVDYYMANARLLAEQMLLLGYRVAGGTDAPFVWLEVPGTDSGKKFFEQMLYSTGVVCTPGEYFGPSGNGYVRFSALRRREDIEEAVRRIREWHS